MGLEKLMLMALLTHHIRRVKCHLHGCVINYEFIITYVTVSYEVFMNRKVFKTIKKERFSMKNTKKLRLIIALFVIIIIGFTSCNDVINEKSNEPVKEPDSNPSLLAGAKRAMPVAASNNPNEPVILDKFTESNKNWYVIDAGYINDTYVMQMGPTEYLGFGSVSLTRQDSVETSVSRSSTMTVSDSVVVSDGTENLVGLDTAVTTSITIGTENAFFTALASLGLTVSERVESSRKIDIAKGRSKETSEEFITTLMEATSNSVSVTINKEDPIGFYRYAWYAVSDVYFIISTSTDRQQLYSWDVIVAQRDGTTGRFEYSPDGRFNNSPNDNLIVFSKEFWKKLPTPSETTYSLTTNVNIEDGGTVLRTPDAKRYDFGTYVMLTAIPKPAYKFVNWTGTGVPTGMESSAGIIITVDKNLSLTANFELLPVFYTLTTNVNIPERGTVSTNPDAVLFSPSQQVLVTANPSNGYGFINWTGTDAPTGTAANNPIITVTMNKDLTLIANFGVEKKIEQIYNASQSDFSPGQTKYTYTLPNNVGYPATVEVYALGAGGGGQGGSEVYMVFSSNNRGTGGSGGGGAAAFMRFTINAPVQFDIGVGNRGQGGKYRYYEGGSGIRRGYEGTDGANTTVNVAGHQLTVTGGQGGGKGGEHAGGSGGAVSSKSLGINSNDWQSSKGENGQSCGHKVFLTSRGGSSGSLSIGSLNPYSGGAAPYNTDGSSSSNTYNVWNTSILNNVRCATNPGAGGSGGHGSSIGVAGGGGRVIVRVSWVEL